MQKSRKKAFLWGAVALVAMLAIISGIYFLSIPHISSIEEHTSLPHEGVKSLAVEAYSSDVNVLCGGNEFKMRLYGKTLSDENYRAHMTVTWDETDPERLVVRETRKALDLRFSSGEELTLEITLPAAYKNGLSVESTAGDVSVDGIACHSWVLTLMSGDVSVKNAFFATSESPGFDSLGSGSIILGASGNALLENVVNDSVSVFGASGRIASVNCTTGNFKAETISGNIDISALNTGGLKVSTTSGKVDANMKKLTAEAMLDSMGGSITLTLPSGVPFDIEASSASGRVTQSVPSTEGAVPIVAAALTGNIEVR